eukprot:scaffold29920_cov65-Cyclotella_meneghiniana.AAC.1
MYFGVLSPGSTNDIVIFAMPEVLKDLVNNLPLACMAGLCCHQYSLYGWLMLMCHQNKPDQGCIASYRQLSPGRWAFVPEPHTSVFEDVTCGFKQQYKSVNLN